MTERATKSQVPDFIVSATILYVAGMSLLEVTCHRCKGKFYLESPSSWFEAHGETRPCPSCWKVSRVP